MAKNIYRDEIQDMMAEGWRIAFYNPSKISNAKRRISILKDRIKPLIDNGYEVLLFNLSDPEYASEEGKADFTRAVEDGSMYVNLLSQEASDYIKELIKNG